MIYVYSCNGCGGKFDIIKPVGDYNRPEFCPTSHVTMTRAFAPQIVYLSGTEVQERAWNPAFGQALTRNEAKQIAKDKGMIEVGNERPEKHLKPNLSSYDE